MKALLRVLNLEDNIIDAELNQAMISARWPQCEFTRVDSREKFNEMLDWRVFDLILSDYTMPGFNGIEALAIARMKRPEVPFLFVSGTIGEDSAIEAMKNGATDYVLKHRLMRLIPAVDRALHEAEERAERERAEKSMRESEHKYRELFECLGEAAFLADEKSGKIIDTNRCAEKTLGCGRSEILGRKITSFLNEPTGDGAAAAGKPVEGALTVASGKSVPVRVQTTKLTLYDHPLVLRLCHEI
ncbi:MAG TPA: response regulator [Candidatus Sulfotelmatobacter sp.]|jgi:CheY-like chemotaxis protein|nr:response regulator [Candidatus Sulfotelmatobacter sp.]